MSRKAKAELKHQAQKKPSPGPPEPKILDWCKYEGFTYELSYRGTGWRSPEHSRGPGKQAEPYCRRTIRASRKPYLETFFHGEEATLQFTVLTAHLSIATDWTCLLGSLLPTLVLGKGGAIASCYVWWRMGRPISNVTLLGMAEDGQMVVAVGERGRIYRSAGASSWSRCNSPGKNTLRAVHYSPEQKLWVSVGCQAIYCSTNGKKWRLVESNSVHHLSGVTFGGGLWMAVGEDGCVLISADGQVWQRQAIPVQVHLRSVVHWKERFVVVGDQGCVLSSCDGHNWTEEVSGVEADLRSVCITPRGLLAVGAAILFSTGPSNWRQIPCSLPGILESVCWTGIMGIAVGGGGNMKLIRPW